MECVKCQSDRSAQYHFRISICDINYHFALTPELLNSVEQIFNITFSAFAMRFDLHACQRQSDSNNPYNITRFNLLNNQFVHTCMRCNEQSNRQKKNKISPYFLRSKFEMYRLFIRNEITNDLCVNLLNEITYE